MNPGTTSTAPIQTYFRLTATDQPLPWNTDIASAVTADDKAVEDCRHWLSLHRLWGQLPAEALPAIAQSLYCFRVEPQTLIYQEGHQNIGLYLLKWGTIEISRRSPIGKSLIRYRYAGDLFGYASLMATPENSRHQTQAIALTASEICFLPEAQFRQWMQQYSELEHLFNARLLTSTPIALALLSLPAVLTYGTHAIARLFDPEQPTYLTVIYAYLPFTLAANLAHYIPAAVTEAGQILLVLARTLGFSGTGLPTLTRSADVAAFLQGVTLLSALVFSVYPLLRITQRPLLSNLPHLILMVGFTILFFKFLI